ncbi:MAG: ATP-binding protein, partial [Gammaproteobacteria bacterium]
ESLLQNGNLPGSWNGERSEANEHIYSLEKRSEGKLALQLWSEEIGLSLHTEKQPEISFEELKNEQISGKLWRFFDDLTQVDVLPQKYERKVAFQLLSKKGDLLLRSLSAPKYSFSPALRGFSKANVDGNLWQVYSISDADSDYVIHVAQLEEIRTEVSDEISNQLVIQFLIGLPVLGVFIWLIVGFALRPVNSLEKSISEREASFLKPLAITGLPNEVVPVIKEINNLFVQLEATLENERRFTADASHELRTPLAGLLTQVQVALKTEDETIRRQALKRIEQAVHRMTYMVNQLLTFSRIESGVDYLAKEPIELAPEIVQVIADLEPEARRKRIQMEFIEENAPPIIANAQLISILIRNIIDNAIKYTPNEGIVSIYLAAKEHRAILSVEDSGPGIAPELYEESLKRFHRCIETANQAQGTGLGFSIVQRIAASHGAEFSLGISRYDGLKVTVSFPLPRRKADKTLLKKLIKFPPRQRR